MKCKYCNADIEQDSLFCSNCGKDLSKLKKCVKCGTLLDDDELFCHECGIKQEIEEDVVQNGDEESPLEKQCIYCGETIEADSAFCPFCGKQQEVESMKEAEPQIDESKPEEEPVVEEKHEPEEKAAVKEAPVQEEPEEQPTYIEEEEKSKTWLYVLLAVLIGGAIWYFFINDAEKSTSNDNTNPVEMTDNTSEEVTDNTPVENEEKVKATPLAFLEQFYKGLEESSYDSDYVRKYITFRAEKYLRDEYDYDCDGVCLATWLFAYEAGSDTGGLRERNIEMIDENTYQVVNIYELEGFEGYTAYEYIVLLGIVKEGNSYKIDTIKVTSSRPIIG